MTLEMDFKSNIVFPLGGRTSLFEPFNIFLFGIIGISFLFLIALLLKPKVRWFIRLHQLVFLYFFYSALVQLRSVQLNIY